MAKGQDLIRFITEKVVVFMDTPQENRRAWRQARQAVRSRRSPWAVRWFGMIPLSIRMWLDKTVQKIRSYK
ncbi:YqzE family protein [Paenibacillus sp. y28]|uniref:YqzE family protein n=1 Tax=Paenibacillus sp. y28 TaxID=3129110 RepID=UPI003018F6F5